MNGQTWWFVARSGGIVAWALVTLSVCWGLFLSTKAVAKASRPAKLMDLHRHLAGLAVAFTAVHMVGLVADSYVEFAWMEVLVPWSSEWRPTAVAWGVIAMYLLVAIELTSLLMKKLPRSVWRSVHQLSFVLYVLATVHGLSAGRDTANVWLRMAMLASINVVAFLTIVLVLARHRRGSERNQVPQARSQPAGAELPGQPP